MVVAYAYCDIKALRRLNPSGVFLLQPGLFPDGTDHTGKAGYGGMSVTYGTGLWHWREGYGRRDGGCDKASGPVNVGCMREFSFDWDELRNADGSEAGIDNGTAGHRGWNLADPLGKGTRELVAKFTAYIAKVDGLYAQGWNGIFSDNWIYGVIGTPYVYGTKLDTNRDGKVDDLASLRKGWDNGLNEVGTRLRSYLPGKIVVGNGNWFGASTYYGDDPEGWLKSANGTVVEGIERFYPAAGDLLKLSSQWLGYRSPKPRYLLFMQKALDAKGYPLNVPSGTDPNDPKFMLDPNVMRSMRWGLTLSMMAGAYYEILLGGDQSTRWWYDEYDGGKGVRQRDYLGRVLGAPAAVRPGVWRRDFERGIALNNSSSKAVTIDLKKQFRHLRGTQNPRLNNGKVVTSITLPGHDGVILLTVKPQRK